jgi:hypothetical protein
VPRIGGRLQAAGPRFGGGPLAQGEIVDHGLAGPDKFVVIDLAPVYGLPALTRARRTLRLAAGAGDLLLEDVFEFSGDPLEVEEAFVTWEAVSVAGPAARIAGRRAALCLTIQEPAGASFSAARLEDECRVNQRDGTLTRLSVGLPAGARRFVLKITPQEAIG